MPEDKVVVCQLRQTLLQKRVGACDLRMYTYNESRVSHRICNLPLEQAKALLDGTPMNTKDD